MSCLQAFCCTAEVESVLAQLLAVLAFAFLWHRIRFGVGFGEWPTHQHQVMASGYPEGAACFANP